MAEIPPPAILTIGHSDRSLEMFLALLQAHAVTQVVDVRKMPRSRHNPQFNRDTFPIALRAAGVEYLEFPGLGGMRRPHTDSPNIGWRNASFRGYADYMLSPEFEQSIQELLAQVAGQRPVLMCAEAVPWRCHRSWIADTLVVRGIPVAHILGLKQIQTHVLRPWARVQGTRITYPRQTEDLGLFAEEGSQAASPRQSAP
jgi:uncharacterized protein (DUF488 family)